MRIIVVFQFLLFVLVLLYFADRTFAQNCKTAKVGEDRRVCSHMVVEIRGSVSRELVGVVVDANGEPIVESVIEVYEAKKDGKLVATYKTGIDGRFCIKKLIKGRYSVKVGWSRLGFNCTDVEVEIKGKTKRFLEIELPIGT